VKAIPVDPKSVRPEDITGRVIAHTVRRQSGKGVLLRKGQQLTAEDLGVVRQARGELHLLEAEPGDIHEDLAGGRLARAAAGPGISVSGPAESQYQLEAARRGLFRVDPTTLRQINQLEGLSVFTTFDWLPVDSGDGVGAAKVTPILVAERLVERAESICGERPPLQVKPFRPCRVAALVLDRVDQPTRERFARDMGRKLDWFGSTLLPVQAVENTVDAFARAFGDARQQGAHVIMAAGASSLDPLEPLFLALHQVGAKIEKHGVPAHPGSLFWMAYLEDVPVFGLSSCEMFSHKTILDLVLPQLLAGERVNRESLVEMAHGGYLARYMAFRFPPYEGRRDGASAR
jgi:hypothetical protein